MSQTPDRCPHAEPRALLLGVLLAVLGSWGVVLILGMVAQRQALTGVLAGGLIAVGALLSVLQAGRILARSQAYAATMLWLAAAHLVLWIQTAILIGVLKVDPIAFCVGVSILPIGVVVATVRHLATWKNSQS